MLSTNYRLKLQNICERIATHQEVSLDEMVWAEKLGKSNSTASTMLRQSRRKANNPNMQEGDLDDFLNSLDLGDPDPTNHKTGFDTVDEIVDFFKRNDNENNENWRRRD